MAITIERIKELRDLTGVSVMQCKKALEQAEGDLEKAKVILRKQSAAAATKKADRTLGAGIASAYTHAGGQVMGAVVLGCETDFVARNPDFGKLAHDIAMHVAAMDPIWKDKSGASESDLSAAKSVFEQEVAKLPEGSRAKALEGKLASFVAEKALLEQAFVKDSERTVRQLIEEAIQKFGEKIEITRFERLSVK